jgi:hypothetical protein
LPRRKLGTRTPVEIQQAHDAAVKNMREMFERWVREGAVVCIYQNQAFDSAAFGQRFALRRSAEEAAGLKLGEPAPDTTTIGVGWRWLLVDTQTTVDGAMLAMEGK